MKRLIVLTCSFVTASGCDWNQFQFMGSVPLSSDPRDNPEVHVILGVDGLDYGAVKEAREAGAFPGRWSLSPLVSIFPATSDASWTRILHTQPLPSYEFQYYDPSRDEVEHPGLLGAALHILPPFTDSIYEEAPYLRAFDSKGSGFTHGTFTYLDPAADFGESLDGLFSMLEGYSQTDSVFTAYLLGIDVMGHIKPRSHTVEAILGLSERIQQFKSRHPERRFFFTILSDHGIDFTPVDRNGFVNMSDELAKVGISSVDHLEGTEGTLAAIPIVHTRVTYVALHCREENAAEVAKRLSSLESVDLAVAKEGSSYVVYGDGKKALSYTSDSVGVRSQCQSPTISRLTEFCGGEETLQAPLSYAPDSPYPDLYYRVKTGLDGKGVEHAAQVIVSFKAGYASIGFELPGGADSLSSSYGFHGALRNGGSLGVALTEERDLPNGIRADDVLDSFPELHEALAAKGILKE